MHLLPTPPRWAMPLLVAALAALVAAVLAPGSGGATTATGRLTALDDTTVEVARETIEALLRDRSDEVAVDTGVDREGGRTLELRLTGSDRAASALAVNRALARAAERTDALVEPAVVARAPASDQRVGWALLAALVGFVATVAVVTRWAPAAAGTAPRDRSGGRRSSLPVDHLYAETDPESDASIAVHELADRLLERSADGTPARRVVVAGTVPADRSAELATNLAIALAHHDVAVRLLDQDRATAAVAGLLGIEEGRPGTIPLGGGRSVDCLTIARGQSIPFSSSGARAAMDQWLEGYDVLVVHLAPRASLDDVVRWSTAADAVLVARSAGRPPTSDDAWATDGTIPPGRHLGTAHLGAVDP